MNKGGISAIVATVLIILITVAAVTIIWVAIVPMIQGNLDKIGEDVRLDIVNSEYTAWDSARRLATVQIERGADDSDLIGFNLIFSFEGTSVEHYISDVPLPNAARVYYINLSNSIGVLWSIKIAPVFGDGRVGGIVDEVKFEDLRDRDLQDLIDNENVVFEDLNLGGGEVVEEDEVEPEYVMSIEQFGITWTFDKAYETGTFANGDHWVVGPVTIVGISPKSENISGRIMHGSMINPDPLYLAHNNLVQGYDSAVSNKQLSPPTNVYYNETLNVALNVGVDGKTLDVPVDSSLMSSISNPTPYSWPQLETITILTILDSAPASGSFRPPYIGNDKTIKFNEDDLNYSILGNLPAVANMPTLEQTDSNEIRSSLASVERKWKRPFVDQHVDWVAGRIQPSQNMEKYGREIAQDASEASLILNIDMASYLNDGRTNEEIKRNLYVYLVQAGIDISGAAENGMYWLPAGGIMHGRKFMPLLAGLAMIDSNPLAQDILDIVREGTYYDPFYGVTIRLFMEDTQAGYVSQADIDMVQEDYVPGESDTTKHPDYRDWDDSDNNGKTADSWQGYEQSDLGLPEWGIRYETNPLVSHKYWNTLYRRNEVGRSIVGYGLATLIMGAKEDWNNSAFFDYVDRYMIYEPVWNADNGGTLYMPSSFVQNMWDTYRGDYVAVWQCIDSSIRSCSQQQGVCSGSSEACNSGQWSGCDYDSIPNYNPVEICGDGWDNDCNGAIDNVDFICGGTETSCIDSIDNDMDGDKDCADDNCLGDPACEPPIDYISYWKFDDDADDENGVNNGVFVDHAGIVSDGVRGDVLSLDGAGDRVDVLNFNGDTSSEGTVTFWVNQKSANDYAGYVQAPSSLTMMFRTTSSVRVQVYNTTGVKQIDTTCGEMTLDEWKFVAFTWDDDAGITYIDGAYCSQDTSTASPYMGIDALRFGSNGNSASRYLNGLMDDVMIYNRSLSVSEIGQIYNAQV